MYTRPYNDDVHGIVIPESYGGTLLRDTENPTEKIEEAPAEAHEDTAKNPWEKESASPAKDVHKKEESAEAFSFLSNLPFSNFLTKLGINGKFGLQKIGTEEILIIATAAFLFFSKEGDKECAIMLLLLLFLA